MLAMQLRWCYYINVSQQVFQSGSTPTLFVEHFAIVKKAVMR